MAGSCSRSPVPTAGPASGAAIGFAFGLARTLPQLATASVRGPESLIALDRRLRSWERPAHRGAVTAQVGLAVAALVAAVLAT